MSFLIEPVQRIPRYILLLERLTHFSQTNVGYVNLQDVLGKMKDLAQEINRSKRVNENLRHLFTVQMCIEDVNEYLAEKSGRIYISEGAIEMKRKHGFIPMYLILMNDKLLFCKNKRSKLFFKGEIVFGQNVELRLSGKQGFQLDITSEEVCQVSQFRSATTEERDDWIKLLQPLLPHIVSPLLMQDSFRGSLSEIR